jgi:hypothetical protein
MKNGSDIISRNYAQNSQYLEQTLQVVTTLAVGDYVSCKTEKKLCWWSIIWTKFLWIFNRIKICQTQEI